MVEFLHRLLDIMLHLDHSLNAWAGELGPWLYLVLFVIVFCETGLVVTPFLPGDSLLFAVGALASRDGSPIDLSLTAFLLCTAAILGDAVNYSVGAAIGPRVFSREDSRWLNKGHLERTHQFYEKHGGKTIILARFIPIVRTFAPFVAGIGRMGYPRFALYNVVGGVVWVLGFLFAGYLFADLPVVRDQFHLVIFAIIVISMMPLAIEYWRSRRQSRAVPGD